MENRKLRPKNATSPHVMPGATHLRSCQLPLNGVNLSQMPGNFTLQMGLPLQEDNTNRT